MEDRITPSSAANAAELATQIQQDNTNNTADTIVLTGSVNAYQLTGQLEITDKAGLTIQGQGQTIDASAAHNRAFLIDKGGTNILFQNLTIQGGVATDNGTASSTEADGGGILDLGGNVTLSHVVLQSNKADAGKGQSANGGGIYVKGGSLTIQSSVIQHDSAVGGGAVTTTGLAGSGVGGGVFASGTTTVTLSTLSNNDASGENTSGGDVGGTASGGGIFANGTTSITASTLSGNTLTGGNSGGNVGGGADGGGISAEGTTSITSSKLTGNTLTGGSSGGLGGGAADGGGISAQGTTSIIASTLIGNTLSGGSCSGSGSGGEALGGGGSVSGTSAAITDSSLSGNKLTGGSGTIGGQAQGGGLYTDQLSTTTITTSSLSSNILTGGKGDVGVSLSTPFVGGPVQGGGIYAGGPTTIRNSLLSGNTLTGGDGSIANNTASVSGDIGGDVAGGGVYASGSTTINSSLLSANTLSGGTGHYTSGNVAGNTGGNAEGGGVSFNPFNSRDTLALTASTLSGNTVTGGVGSDGGGGATPGQAQGGGAFFDGTGITLVNSTIADNQAIGGGGLPTSPVAAGGGLYFAPTAAATLTNDTVADNEANRPPSGVGTTEGGGIANFGGPITLVNTLVAGNSASNATTIHGISTGLDYFGTVSSSDHNLIGNADGATGFSATSGDQLGTHFNPLVPQLGPLQNNGGTLTGAPGSQQVVPTLALLPASPAINAGDNSAESVTGQFDQRGQGFTRVFGGNIDIGAFEVQPPPPPTTTGSTPGHAPPPTLHTPPLLAFFDALFGGIETINDNGTETVTDSIFGILLFVSTYDSNGNLLSVTIFGIDVTALFESL